MSSKIEDAYVIGAENFNSWSQGFDPSGYLKVLPHPDLKVVFKDPFRDWQEGRSGNYVSSWGANKDLNITLKMDDLEQVAIDGLGILKAGDGVIPWLGNKSTPYEQLRGYNGTIPGPMLITEPSDTLSIYLQNDLGDPRQVSNLHVHGLHVSPVGHGDNVLHTVKTGENWLASIDLPDDAYIGLDWYHPHVHGLTNEQVSSGLAGQLVILAPHDIPDLSKFDPRTQPFHFMSLNTFGLQQVDRVGKPNDPLNQNPNTPLPAGTPLKVDGVQNGEPVYTLSDAPFVGYNGKPLPFLYDPTQPTGNPAQNKFGYGSGAQGEPVENVIYTVNGQYNPTIDVNTGQWNVFSFTNMSTNTFHVIDVVKKEGDQLIPQKVQVVGLDGDASGVTSAASQELITLPILSPGQRISFQEWFQDPGTYYLLSNGTDEILGDNTPSILKGQKGFSDGHLIWGPQVLATINVTGNSIPQGSLPQAYDFLAKQAEKTDQLIADSQNGQKVDRNRTFIWSANLGGAFLLGHAVDDTDAASFEGTYGINGKYFAQNFTDSMVPLTMPMLGSTEVWDMVNTSGVNDPNLPPQANIPLLEWHPFHIHQNDFTVLSINGIAAKDIKNTYINGALQDTISLAPTYDPSIPPSADNPYGVPMQGGTPSSTEVLMKFEDFPGTFVNHCHILFHEDAGMMAPVRVILNTRETWLGLGSHDGKVELYRASDPQKSVFLAAYGDSFQGEIETAIGDINYQRKVSNTNNVTDNVTDVAVVQSSVAQGQNRLTVKVFDGQRLFDQQQANFQKLNGNDSTLLLTEFTPFLNVPLTVNTKAAIATGDINGDGFSDVIVGISGDRSPNIEIYSGKDFSLLSRVTPFTTNSQFHGVMSIASGDVDGDNFDDVIVGGHGSVEIYSGKSIDIEGSPDGRATAAKSSLLSETLHPYGHDSHGAIEVTSGYVLQRPDVPNNSPTQTYHANITTLLKGDLPEGEQAVKVFTFTGGEHHSSGGSGTSTDGAGSEHSAHSAHAADTEHSSGGETLPANIRLDVAFTPGFKLDNLYGTFADLPDLPRGEPVLFARDASGGSSLIHLGEQNVHTAFTLTEGDHTPTEQHTHPASDRSDIVTQGGSLSLASTDADVIVCSDCNLLDELQTLGAARVAIDPYSLDLGYDLATVSHLVNHGDFGNSNFLLASNAIVPEVQ